jgi:MFS family permease
MPFSQAFDPIRSLKVAWQLLKQAPLSVLVGTLLPIFVSFVLGVGLDLFLFLPLGLSQSFQRGRPEPWMFVLLFALGSVFGLLMMAFSSWMDAGFGRAVEHALRTGKDSASLVFSGAGRFVVLLLARLLVGLVAFACMLVLVLPILLLMTVFSVLIQTDLPTLIKVAVGAAIGLLWLVGHVYVLLGLSLVTAVVVYEDCGPGQAIARSWRLVRGNRWQLVVFFLFQFLMVLAGMLVCGIGWFVAVPLTEVMRLEAYLALTKAREYPSWWVVTGKFPFDEHKPEDYGSPPVPPPVPPPLPPQT